MDEIIIVVLSVLNVVACSLLFRKKHPSFNWLKEVKRMRHASKEEIKEYNEKEFEELRIFKLFGGLMGLLFLFSIVIYSSCFLYSTIVKYFSIFLTLLVYYRVYVKLYPRKIKEL